MRSSFFCLLVVAASCAPVYIPNQVNAPLLTGQNEIQVAGSIGSNGADVQAAYAVTDEIGVMANFSAQKKGESSSSDYHKHMFKEIGLGYQTPMGRNGVFDIYAGVGSGTSSSRDSYTWFGSQSVAADGNYRRIFIQPSAGRRGTGLHAALSTRLAWVTFTKFESGGNTVKKNYTQFYIEPVVTTRLGFENFKFQTQIGLSLPLDHNRTFEHQPVIFNIGLFLNLNHSDGADE